MNRTRILAATLFGLTLLSACGGEGAAPNPTPSISNVAPSAATVGAAAQILVINGSGFLANSTATYNGSARAPTYVNATRITIQLSAADQATAGAYPILVTNPSPGGGTSNAVDLAVNNPAPAITSLAPASAFVGAAAGTLTVNGSGFIAGSTVTYNGMAHAVANVGANQLTIQLSASDQATAGSFNVVVTNPAPGGGTSNAENFTVAQSGVFTLIGNMIDERFEHTATLLLDGTTVLIAGGKKDQTSFNNGTINASAELFDSTSGLFTATGGMATPRSGHSATLLANTALAKAARYGMVLVTGGGVQTAELYDPVHRVFTAAGSLLVVRTGQTATLLNTGEVLLTGGGTDTAELYDPVSGLSAATKGNMAAARTGHTATLLNTGEVLVTGGGTATAELYDPVSGLFTAITGSMTYAGRGATATLLHDDTVLLAGSNAGAEIFNPATASFAPVGGGSIAGAGAAASLLSDGTVLITGGAGGRNNWQSHPFAVLFTPLTDSVTVKRSLNFARDGHSSTLLADGTVLIAGGESCSTGFTRAIVCTSLSSAELYK